ncbi:MAG: exodeoxyribonuclease VII small subunit [Deltaproteobacteria bacterium]|nr:exodeoxyribonuclease VII small subunit [Deltaproteobacteria bacterium]
MTESGTEERFEELLARLESIVRALESEELDLEASLLAYEEGVKLARACHERLDEADRRVEVLRRLPSGAVTSEPLDHRGED